MQSQRGFTLLELLCVLAVLSIAGMMGMTGFLWAQQSQESKTVLLDDVKNLSNALQQARQLAISSGQASYVCGGQNCSGNWSYGFRVVQPENLGGLYRKVVFDHDVHIEWHGFPATKSRIDFLPNGLSSYQNGTFVLCYQSYQVSIVLNQSGRYYTSELSDAEDGACS